MTHTPDHIQTCDCGHTNEFHAKENGRLGTCTKCVKCEGWTPVVGMSSFQEQQARGPLPPAH